MKIETFEVISIDEQDGQVVNEQVSEEAMALIESLGLEGQRELLAEREAGGEAVMVRNPYRKMSGEEFAIFSAVLPRRVVIERYNDGPIPLRVLQIAAHAKDLFDDVVIWCPADPAKPDPLLVGVKGGTTWQGNTAGRSGGDSFLLARWGEVLEPMDTLREQAKRLVIASAKASVAQARAKVMAFESGLDEKIEAYLLTGKSETEWLPTLSFTV